jgi:hypothetical protein
MQSYVQVAFYMGVFGAVVRLLTIGSAKYPRSVEHTLGLDLVVFMVHLGFTIWAGFLVMR